ncbi:MAG: insulinase family protein [Proteobacteria bacterium]|nr:insulinase family protein [Pseudomonadota bacterium]
MFKAIRPVLFLLLLLLPAFFASAAPAAAPAWPHDLSDLAPDPAVTYAALDNGLRVILLPNREPRDRVAVYLDVQVGSLWENEAQRGVAHFLEHMMFNGTRHFAPDEMVEYFQSLGMRFGPDVNAHTGFDETVYHVLLPDGSQENLDRAFTVMEDWASGALLLPEQIDKEKGVILAEMQARDSVGYRTFVATFRFLLPGTRASQRMPIGKKEVIENADQALMKSFYDAWYRPDKLALVVVGDFDPKLALSMIRERFSGLSVRMAQAQEPPAQTVKHRGLETFYHHEKEAGNTTVSIETARTVEPSPDSFEKEKLWLLRSMAEQIVGYRLDRIMADPQAPLVSADISSGEFLQTVEFTSMTAHCPPQRWEEALGILERELRRALLYGFTEAEVARVKKDVANRLETAAAKAPTRDSDSLARGMIRTLNNHEVFQSPARERELYSPVVDGATAQSLHAALAGVWPRNHRLVQVTGNAEIVPEEGAPEEAIRAVFAASLAQRVDPPKEKAAARFPYLPAPDQVLQPTKTLEYPDLEVKRAEWGPGLVLLYKKTDFKTNEVLLSLDFGHGEAGEPERASGLSSIASAVVAESGLGRLARDEMSEALAGTSTSISLVVHQDRFALAGATVPGELELAVRLLYHQLKDPAFREDGFNVAMRRFTQRHTALSHTVDGIMAIDGDRFLADGDSRYGLPAPEIFSAYKVKAVRDWLLPALARAPLSLSVVGDFDEDELLSLVGRYLASLKRDEEPLPLSRSAAVGFPTGESRRIEVETEIEKGLAVVAWPTDDTWNIRQGRRLNVLSNVLTDRMRKVLREKLGLTYSPFAWNMGARAYPGYGLFQARVTADPANLDQVIAELRLLGQDLAEGGITADELSRALEPTLAGIREQLRKNSYWLNTVLSGAGDHPEQLDWARTILSDYSSVTVPEVEAVAKEFLQDEAAATLEIFPVKAEGEGEDGAAAEKAE